MDFNEWFIRQDKPLSYSYGEEHALANQWISTKKLPEHDRQVLTYTPGHKQPLRLTTGQFVKTQSDATMWCEPILPGGGE